MPIINLLKNILDRVDNWAALFQRAEDLQEFFPLDSEYIACNSDLIGSNRQKLRWAHLSGDSVIDAIMPDIDWVLRDGKSTKRIGAVKDITMSQGIVTIPHFALLDSNLTHNGIGSIFIDKIIETFQQLNVTEIHFRETHSTKVEHYRRFFEKIEIPEVEDRRWVITL